MVRYKFTQADWKQVVLFSIIPVLFFRALQNYFSTGWAMLATLVAGLLFVFLLGNLFIAVVEFKDEFLLLKNGFFRKEVKVNYSEINKATFTHDRFLNFYIYTAGNKLKLPTPARLNKAEELFNWLRIQNPAMQVEIIS